jgi:hypothetical protein
MYFGRYQMVPVLYCDGEMLELGTWNFVVGPSGWIFVVNIDCVARLLGLAVPQYSYVFFGAPINQRANASMRFLGGSFV